MYAYIKGLVAERSENTVVLDAGGIGYELFVSANTAETCTVGEEKKLFTHLGVKEDEMSLYGFGDKSEKTMFLQLVSISGIGPKLAISILGGARLRDLKQSIASGNASALNGIKGVGKKTAERIIIELKDKMNVDGSEFISDGPVVSSFSGKAEEAIAVLVALGIKRDTAEKSVALVYDETLTVNQIVHKAISG